MPMRIAFRVDSSPHIGSGHFRRCLSLANEARLLGLDTLFIAAFLSSSERITLSESGHAFARLDVLPKVLWNTASNPDWNSVIAVDDEIRDADGTSLLLKKFSSEFIVLDHYFLTQRWVDRVRDSSIKSFIAIEDLDREWTDIEFVVNGNLNQSVSLHPDSRAVALSGGKFAIISSEYRLLRNKGILPPSARQQVTISIGGSDPKGLTALLLSAVLDVCRDDWPIEVVVGAFFKHLEPIRQLTKGFHQTMLSVNKPSMADSYSKSRLALGAGGTSAWERACLGVPAVLLSIAPNQVSVCESLARAGGAIYLGPADHVTRQQVSGAVSDLISSPALLDESSQAGSRAIDGYGAKRIIQIVGSDQPNNPELRKATELDCEILFEWFNDPSTRVNSLSQTPVSWSDHNRWFYNQLKSKDAYQFILECLGLPVGQIRFDFQGDSWLLSYSIDRDFRGRGYGRLIVELGLKSVTNVKSCPIRAIVKSRNLASIHIFDSLSFTRCESEISDCIEFVLNR